MSKALISKIIKPSSKYICKADNYIDFLEPKKKSLKKQDAYYNETTEEFPKTSRWDMSYFKSINYTILAYLGKVKSKLILDLGSGVGSDTQLLTQKGARVVSLDSAEKSLRISSQVNQNLHIRADATQLPFKNNVFDLVFGREILHHLDEDKVLNEIKRVLKKDGRAVFEEALKLNPVIAIYRLIYRSKRVPQHPFLPWHLPELSKKYFKTCEVRFFYALLPIFYFIMIYFPKLNNWASKIYTKKISKLDDAISNSLPYFAWNQVIKLTV